MVKDHLKTNANDHSKTGLSGFLMATALYLNSFVQFSCLIVPNLPITVGI
jgi:hypothetical protein